MRSQRQNIRSHPLIASALLAGMAALPCRAQAPVYVPPFAQEGAAPAFPNLSGVLTSAVRLRLGQLPALQVAADENPCKSAVPRTPPDPKNASAGPEQTTQPAPRLAPNALYYAIRGTVEVHAPEQGPDTEVLVTYELTRGEACSTSEVKLKQTDKFALADVLGRFSSIGDRLAAALRRDLRPPVRVDLLPVEVTGGGDPGTRAASAVRLYLSLRLSAADDVVYATPQHAADPRPPSDYLIRSAVSFSPDRSRMQADVRLLSSDGNQQAAIQRSLQVPKQNTDGAFNDFALDLASATMAELTRVREARASGADRIPATDPTALVAKARSLMCDPLPAAPCTPQAREALAYLGKLLKPNLTVDALELIGRARFALVDYSAASTAFEDALKTLEAAVPARRLPLLRESADAYYAGHDFAHSAAAYQEYFQLAGQHQRDLPAFWERAPEACVNWTHSVWLKGDHLPALDVLLHSCAEVANRGEFQTEVQFILGEMNPAELQTAIDTLTAAKSPLAGEAMARLGDYYYEGKSVPQNYQEALRWFERGAKAGNLRAKMGLAALYEEGKGVKVDHAAARRLYGEAAEAGDPGSMAYLAYMCETGIGGPADHALALQWYRKAAAAGDGNAMTYLGALYEEGKGGLPHDDAKAMDFYQRAAAAGVAEGVVNIGRLYYMGRGVSQDYTVARQYFERSAALGEPAAKYYLGAIYQYGQGVAADPSVARRWYQDGAAGGDAWAMESLGYMYEAGLGGAPDYTLARQWYEKAAAAGNPDGWISIGGMYLSGRGVAQDAGTAVQWFRKAADAGSGAGMTALGRLYLDGDGVPQDLAQARQWFERGVAAGDSSAKFELGLLAENSGDFAGARRWYQEAAAASDSPSMTAMGRLYEAGSGVPRDYDQARRWYEKAAAAGDGAALRSLGRLYEKGLGVPRNYTQARQYYEKGAALRDAPSMTALGDIYHNGLGVAKDEAAARQWYEQAASAGDPDARKRVKSQRR
jgi:uncharacterized protein